MDEKTYSLTSFGQLCFDARTRLTMTKPELARQVGSSPADISRIERGEKEPPAEYVVIAMGILGLSQSDVEAALSKPDGSYKITRISQSRYGAHNG